MKAEVYSWRVSAELKAELERHARLRKVRVSSILELAVQEWLSRNGEDARGDNAQRRLHAAAARCLGVFEGQDPPRAESSSAAVRQRLRKHHGR